MKRLIKNGCRDKRRDGWMVECRDKWMDRWWCVGTVGLMDG